MDPLTVWLSVMLSISLFINVLDIIYRRAANRLLEHKEEEIAELWERLSFEYRDTPCHLQEGDVIPINGRKKQ